MDINITKVIICVRHKYNLRTSVGIYTYTLVPTERSLETGAGLKIFSPTLSTRNGTVSLNTRTYRSSISTLRINPIPTRQSFLSQKKWSTIMLLTRKNLNLLVGILFATFVINRFIRKIFLIKRKVALWSLQPVAILVSLQNRTITICALIFL